MPQEIRGDGELVMLDGQVVARLSPKAGPSLRQDFTELVEGMGVPADPEFLKNLEAALKEDAEGDLLTISEAMAAFKDAIEKGY